MKTRFTFDADQQNQSVWSPDGSHIVFSSSLKGHDDLYQKASDNSGRAEVVLEDNFEKFSGSWSPDGRFNLYSSSAGPAGGDRVCSCFRFLETANQFRFCEQSFSKPPVKLSPDGRWVAYVSNEIGHKRRLCHTIPGS